MRQRTVKNREAIIEECGAWLVRDPRSRRGSWSSVFGNEAPVHVELGSGKGQFITRMALIYPELNFVAAEKNPDVAVRILQKARDLALANIRVIIEEVGDTGEIFAEGEVAAYYLNFSDPWPRRVHERRRLTYRTRLESYAATASEGAFLAVRTDNRALFDFSLSEMKKAGIEPETVSYDLHSEEYFAGMVTTEYEDKFAEEGLPIYYVKAPLRDRTAVPAGGGEEEKDG
ncbi:MAG: tRNA (guanosine(46)-N7)-methyltransferase TrmB [Firmicutes bacterium]|nr:tRNA (guanosine(46)-N7)-methyltransferase TrmB [Bacillota bacterium]